MTKVDIIKMIEYSIKKYYKKIIDKIKNNSNVSIEKIIYKMKKNKNKIFYNYELYKKYRDTIISKNSTYYFFDKIINTSNSKIIYIDVIKKSDNKTKYICAFNNKKFISFVTIDKINNKNINIFFNKYLGKNLKNNVVIFDRYVIPSKRYNKNYNILLCPFPLHFNFGTIRSDKLVKYLQMLKCKKINIPVINSKIKIKKSSSDSTKKKHCEKKQCEKKKCEDIVYKDELEENELCDGIYNLLENINNTQLPRLGTLNDYVDIIKDVNEYNELNDKQKLLIDNEIKEIEEYSKNLQVFGEIYKQVGDQLKLNKNDYRESFYKLKKSLGNITNTMNNFNLLQNKIKTINKNKINQLEKQNKLNKVILGLSNLKKLIYNCIN